MQVIPEENYYIDRCALRDLNLNESEENILKLSSRHNININSINNQSS